MKKIQYNVTVISSSYDALTLPIARRARAATATAAQVCKRRSVLVVLVVITRLYL